MSDALRIVREALVRFENGAVDPHAATTALTALDSLADQVRAEERERIAVFVETASVPIGIEHWMSTKKALSAATARAIADAIRARGEDSTDETQARQPVDTDDERFRFVARQALLGAEQALTAEYVATHPLAQRALPVVQTALKMSRARSTP